MHSRLGELGNAVEGSNETKKVFGLLPLTAVWTIDILGETRSEKLDIRAGYPKIFWCLAIRMMIPSLQRCAGWGH